MQQQPLELTGLPDVKEEDVSNPHPAHTLDRTTSPALSFSAVPKGDIPCSDGATDKPPTGGPNDDDLYIDPAVERALLRKLDLRIAPLIMALYLTS